VGSAQNRRQVSVLSFQFSVFSGHSAKACGPADLARLFVPAGTPENSPPLQGWGVRPPRGAVPAGTKEVSVAKWLSTSSAPPSPTNIRTVFRPLRNCAGDRSLIPPLKRWTILNRPYRDEEVACLARQVGTNQLSPAI